MTIVLLFRHYDLGYGSGRSLIQIAADGVRVTSASTTLMKSVKSRNHDGMHRASSWLTRGITRRFPRVPHSNFTEYFKPPPSQTHSEFGANVNNQAIFLADAVYTPEVRRCLCLPWWSRFKLIEEPRVAGRQFRSDGSPSP